MKEKEKIFFTLCYRLNGLLDPLEVFNYLANYLNFKQCEYYLSKWALLGFYDYGTSIWRGWFYTENIPIRYKNLLEV